MRKVPWRTCAAGTWATCCKPVVCWIFLDVRGNIDLSRKLLGLKDDGSVDRLAGVLDIADQLGKKSRVTCPSANGNG